MRKVLLGIAMSLIISIPAFAGQESLTPEKAYQPILDSYTNVVNASLNGVDTYKLSGTYDVNDYWLSMLPRTAGVKYAFYDIDHNGVMELFIGGDEGIVDVFGYDGNKPVRLVDLPRLGEMRLYQNGILEIYAYGGQAEDYGFYQLTANGYTTERIDHFFRSFGQCSRNDTKITEYDFQQAINNYQKVSKAQLSWTSFPDIIYRGSLQGDLNKKDGVYWYSGIIEGFDKSVLYGSNWTEGYYDLTSGDFYVDDLTKVVIETEQEYGNYGFPAEGKTAEEWLDDFYSRRAYWMVVNVKVKGNHIEEILGIYSFD